MIVRSVNEPRERERWAYTHAAIELSSLAFSVIVVFSAARTPAWIAAPGRFCPRVFSSVPLTVVGHRKEVEMVDVKWKG